MRITHYTVLGGYVQDCGMYLLLAWTVAPLVIRHCIWVASIV